MDRQKPTPLPDYDLADSSMPARPLKPLVARDDAAHIVLQAIANTMAAAVDLERPATTTGRCMTIWSMVAAAANTGDVQQLLRSLDQLTRSWGAPDGAA